MSRRRRILGADPAMTTGVGLLFGRQRAMSGIVKMPVTRKRDHPGNRLSIFRAKLDMDLNVMLVAQGSPDLLVIEWAQSMRSGAAMAMHGYIRGVLMEWAVSWGIPVMRVGPTTVKLHATGKGNATKDEMVAAARRRWRRFTPKTHDEADALWIADYGRVHG